jgi:hypothetical protein
VPIAANGNGSKATLAGSIVALVSAGIGLVVAFGVNLSGDQQRALLTFVTTAVVVAGVVHISRKVAVVATSVDGHLTGLEERIAQLERRLVASGVPIPATLSPPPPPTEGSS